MNTIQLKPKHGKRFIQGHPWVFSNELEGSPKHLPLGGAVELRSPEGKFLAYGYGNPKSLITFRTLSRHSKDLDFYSLDFIAKKVVKAHELRVRVGRAHASHRLCFSEADGLPGLIIDRFRLQTADLFVVQVLTAGMDQLIGDGSELIDKIIPALGLQGSRVGIITRKDSTLRALEGVALEKPQVVRELPGINLEDAAFVLTNDVMLRTNFISGQKTGFFLDQADNILRFLALLNLGHVPQEPVKILDLFTYIGQWGSQLAKHIPNAHIYLVDSSDSALQFAKKNVEQYGQAHLFKLDILKEVEKWPNEKCDVVICDPPALIKNKKDFHNGRRAYLKVNRHALRHIRPSGGWFITCSCSFHLSAHDFNELLHEACHLENVQLQWVFDGGQAMDHPYLIEFPEGNYLKCKVGYVSPR